jgi:uncharacterized C2H2 Zn-finger protein
MSTEKSEIVCPTCEQVFKEERSLSKHLAKKIPCIPKGQARHSCQACNQTFDRKNDLAKHLATKKHTDAVARAASSTVDNSTTTNNHHSHNHTSNVTNNDNRVTNNYTLSNPPPRPRMFGRSDISHIVDLTFKELDQHLKLRAGTGLTPFLNMFKLIHLNDEAPKNHNVLMESKDSDFALTFRQRHWRMIDDPERVFMDCLHETAIQFMDVEEVMQENMSETAYRQFSRLRDLVEYETSGKSGKPAGPEVQRMLDRFCEAIIDFTGRRPDLLEYAKADQAAAPPLEEVPKTRTLPMWQPGGDRFEAFRQMREDGIYARPPGPDI